MITINYYVIAGISILCLIVNLLHLKELDLISINAIKQFKIMAYLIIVEIIIDTLFKMLEGISTTESTVLYVLKALELSIDPLLPYLILKLFKIDTMSIKIIQYIQKIIIVVNIGFQIASLFMKFMFFIDDNNIYQRTNFTFYYIAILAFSFVLMFFAIYSFSLKIQKANSYTLYGLCLMLAFGFISKIISSNTNFYCLCVSIAFFIINIYYVNLSLRLDSLTKLLNRHVYSATLEKINFSTLIIIIDANNFKDINDNYGHECGDRSLKSLAECIFKAYGEYGWCFRIGGDEFCVILKPNTFKKLIDTTPQNDAYLMSEKLMKHLDEIIKSSDKNNINFLNNGVSQGYGIYYSPLEYPNIENNLPLDKVIKLADLRMYKRKAEYKKNSTTNMQTSANQEEDSLEYTTTRPKIVYESKNPELIENSDQE